MTSPENEPVAGTGNQPSTDNHPKPKQEVNVATIGELFQSITVKRLMEEETPGSSSLLHLRDIEENLESSDMLLKAEAGKQLQEVLATREAIDAKAKKIESATDLLSVAKIDDAKKAKLKDVAADIDSIMNKAKTPDLVTNEEIKRAHAELLDMASSLGIKENASGMEETMSRLHWLETAKEARQYVKDRVLYVNPVEEYTSEFDPSGTAKVLKLTDVEGSERDSKQRKLDAFKKHVQDDLIKADPAKIEDLSTDDLIGRLKEATYWQANMGDLQGRKVWLGNENIEQLRDMLGRVEAQYQALLETKMVKNISTQHAAENLDKDLIRESVVQSLRQRRRYLRTEYDFDKNVPQGKRSGEVLEEEVLKGAKKYQKTSEKYTQRQRNNRQDNTRDGFDHAPEDLTPAESEKRSKDILEMQKRAGDAAKKLGIDRNMEKTLRKSPTLREQMFKKAQATLSTEEMEAYSHMHDHWEKTAMGGMRGELSAIQDELEALKGSRQYSKFIIKFKAYVERVGLREASSDWDFAIMMREAKEEISRIHPDAGEKLDQWQEALFAPGLTSLDEKSFFDVMPKMMTQSRLEHEFGPAYANWEAMQVTGSDGTKKVISVAAFHQLLQREDVAKRMLNAITNGNDSAIQEILVEHIWGPGAKLETTKRVNEGLNPKMKIIFADGRAPITDINVSYFSMQDNVFDNANPENLQIEEFIDQSMWMTHYAKTLWSFSGDWEPFLRDFPADQLTQANKRLINIGQAFRDYGLDYGKFDMGYVELAKAGVLLQPFSTYKIADVVKSNLRRMWVDTGVEKNYKDGDKYAAALASAIQKRAFISEKYKPVVAMRSVSEMRLMGSLPTGSSATDIARREEMGWDWFKKNQEALGRKGVLELGAAQNLRSRYLAGEAMNMEDEGWAVQLIEMDKLMDDLASQRIKLNDAHVPEAVLKSLMDKQSLLTTGETYSGPVNMDEYLKRFEFSSLIDHAHLKKGSDPLDYKNYSLAKIEVAKHMTDVLSGSPTLEKINELYNAMKGYMPPEQLTAWFEEYMKTRVKLRTTQFVSYEIAMTDLEVWNMRKKRGEVSGDPPENIIGFNPSTYKIKDERGENWNVVGADGFRVTKKKMERGNHMWKTREIPGLSTRELEMEMRLFVGNRWLPNKAAGHHILENSFGLSQSINQFYKNIGRPDLSDKGLPKFVKKWGSWAIIKLRKHPLFDDPKWAFWSILNEYYEFSKEVGKEMEKTVIGGH